MTRGLVLSVAACFFSMQAWGVIKVESSVSQVFAMSGQVCVGTVRGWSAELKLATVAIDAVYKGSFPHAKVRVQFAQPAGVSYEMREGSPLVLFVAKNDGKSIAIVHAGDTWWLANGIEGANPPAWRTTQIYDGAKSYPGRTIGVVRLAEAFKESRRVLDDSVDPEGFAGRGREVANLGARPAFLVSADFDGDRRTDLVAGTGVGIRFYRGAQGGLEDDTAASGLDGVKAVVCAAGDVDGDGKPDLLLDRDIWIGTGKGFRKQVSVTAEAAQGECAAAAVADAGGDGKSDVLWLTQGGLLTILTNPGNIKEAWAATKTNLWPGADVASAAVFSSQWTEDGAPCLMVVRGDGIYRYTVSGGMIRSDGMERMTGYSMLSCESMKNRPLAAWAAADWDCDGNRKTDFLVVTSMGGVLLMNRGLGAFLVNNVTHEKLKNFTVEGVVRKLEVGCLMAGGTARPAKKWRQSLYVAFPDGRVYEVE